MSVVLPSLARLVSLQSVLVRNAQVLEQPNSCHLKWLPTAAATTIGHLLRIYRSKSTIISIQPNLSIFLWCLSLIPEILVQNFSSLLDSTMIFAKLGCISLIWYRIYWTFLDLAGFSDFYTYLCRSLDFRKDFSGFLRIF